ncbi:hypothetical protein RRG08_043238 [Elysia crispata]|uniref:Uncharacterized protein n=1 Tax=Elysia crispata TaxID=231223 RepID=A0AAE0XXF8_9GAST|nr:hypothetical protein RRG08_043238 [Elysia crispata]
MDVNNDRKRKEELQLTPIMAQDMALYFRKLGTFETAEVAEVATFMRTVAKSLPFIKHVYRDDIAKRWTISKAENASLVTALLNVCRAFYLVTSGHTDHQKRVAYKQLDVQYMLRQVSGHAL